MFKAIWLPLFAVCLFAACIPAFKHAPGKSISDLQSGELHDGANTLPSGRKIIVKNVSITDFDSGEPSALVLNYSTSASIEDMEELRAEVDELWPIFRKNVEAANLTVAALRPVNGSKGYGFVFLKRADGTWYCMDDEKRKEKKSGSR